MSDTDFIYVVSAMNLCFTQFSDYNPSFDDFCEQEEVEQKNSKWNVIFFVKR